LWPVFTTFLSTADQTVINIRYMCKMDAW
jgi:hypothetical protein